MFKFVLFAVALLVPSAALADTYVIPAKVATDAAMCPKAVVVAVGPDATISGEALPKKLGNYADINLKDNTVTVGKCAFPIRGFVNATGAPFGATLIGDDNANVLKGIATNTAGGASDWIHGNGGDDTISVVASSAAVTGDAGKDSFLVPADKTFKLGKKVYTQPIVEDLEAGETVTRR